MIGGIKELDMQVCYPPPLLRLPAPRPYNLSSSSPSPSFFPSLNPHTAVSFFLPSSPFLLPLPFPFPFLSSFNTSASAESAIAAAISVAGARRGRRACGWR